jgi:hypothetical protein
MTDEFARRATEILPFLSDTPAEFLPTSNANTTRHFNVIPPDPDPFTFETTLLEGYIRSPPRIFSPHTTASAGFSRHPCPVTEGSRHHHKLMASLNNATELRTHCAQLRAVYCSSVRFIAPTFQPWHDYAQQWVSDCKAFVNTYGVQHTPDNIIGAFNAVEKRLYKVTSHVLTKGTLDFWSPTGAYAILFASTTTPRHSFSFASATFCDCELSARGELPQHYHRALQIRTALDPSIRRGVRTRATKLLQENTIQPTRQWRISDDVGVCFSAEAVFALASMHIAHFDADGRTAHALVVGPLLRSHHEATVRYIHDVGILEGYTFARNDFTTRPFYRK